MSHGFWQERLGTDPSVLRAGLSLNGLDYPVIGVTPKEFDFPMYAGIWGAWIFTPADQSEGGQHSLNVLACLGPGISLLQAQIDMNNVGGPLAREYPLADSGRDAGAPTVVISNQTLAHEIFPNAYPIDGRMVMGPGANTFATVVVAVGDVRNRVPDAQAQAALSVPSSRNPDSTMEAALLGAVKPTSMATAARNAVGEIDPGQPVFNAVSTRVIERSKCPAIPQ